MSKLRSPLPVQEFDIDSLPAAPAADPTDMPDGKANTEENGKKVKTKKKGGA